MVLDPVVKAILGKEPQFCFARSSGTGTGLLGTPQMTEAE